MNQLFEEVSADALKACHDVNFIDNIAKIVNIFLIYFKKRGLFCKIFFIFAVANDVDVVVNFT